MRDSGRHLHGPGSFGENFIKVVPDANRDLLFASDQEVENPKVVLKSLMLLDIQWHSGSPSDLGHQPLDYSIQQRWNLRGLCRSCWDSGPSTS